MWERSVGGAEVPTSLTVVIPVKDPALAKSRLQPPAGLSRAALATAFHRDTIEAAVGSEHPVAVVSSSPVVTGWCAQLGVRCVPDPGTGLNAGLRAALSLLSGPVMVLMGDVPCVRPADLRRVSDHWHRHRLPSWVPDAPGTGTVAVLAATPHDVPTLLGPGSASRFRQAGLRELMAHPRVRRDVDTWDDLYDAVTLGLGRHTAHVLARHPRHAEGPDAPRPCGQHPALTGTSEGR